MTVKENLFVVFPFGRSNVSCDQKTQRKAKSHFFLGGFFTSIDSGQLEQDLFRSSRKVFLGYKINQLLSIREMKDISNDVDIPVDCEGDNVYLFKAQPIKYTKATLLLSGAILSGAALVASSSQPLERCWIGPFLLFSLPLFLQLSYQDALQKWGEGRACLPFRQDVNQIESPYV